MGRASRSVDTGTGFTALFCLASGALLAACARGSAPPRPEEAPAAIPTSPAPAEPPRPDETAPPAAGAEASAPVRAGRPDGAACSEGAQCESGVCEGQGCGPDEARCAPKMRGCTRDLRPYCGCDGITFHASGNCPGHPYRHRDACP